jgi:hypothetical protein
VVRDVKIRHRHHAPPPPVVVLGFCRLGSRVVNLQFLHVGARNFRKPQGSSGKTGFDFDRLRR